MLPKFKNEDRLQVRIRKNHEIQVKEILGNLMLNVMFLGTFVVKRYIPELNEYRYIVHIDNEPNNSTNYEDIDKRLKIVSDTVKKYNLTRKYWIGLKKDSSRWIIFSNLLNVKFGKHLCRVVHVHVSENEVSFDIVIEGIAVKNVCLNTPSKNYNEELMSNHEGIKINYDKFQYIKSKIRSTVTCCIIFVGNYIPFLREYSWLIICGIFKFIKYTLNVLLIILYILHIFYHIYLKSNNKYERSKTSTRIDCLFCNFKNVFKQFRSMHSSQKKVYNNAEIFKCFCNIKLLLDKDSFIKHLINAHFDVQDFCYKKANIDKINCFKCFCSDALHKGENNFIKHLKKNHESFFKYEHEFTNKNIKSCNNTFSKASENITGLNKSNYNSNQTNMNRNEINKKYTKQYNNKTWKCYHCLYECFCRNDLYKHLQNVHKIYPNNHLTHHNQSNRLPKISSDNNTGEKSSRNQFIFNENIDYSNTVTDSVTNDNLPNHVQNSTQIASVPFNDLVLIEQQNDHKIYSTNQLTHHNQNNQLDKCLPENYIEGRFRNQFRHNENANCSDNLPDSVTNDNLLNSIQKSTPNFLTIDITSFNNLLLMEEQIIFGIPRTSDHSGRFFHNNQHGIISKSSAA